MIASDILLLTMLTAFVLLWWWRERPSSRLLRISAAVLALGAALWGLADDRWQAGAGAVAGLLRLLFALLRRSSLRPRPVLRWSARLLVVMFLALPAAALWLFPIRQLPPPSGPHAVGVRDFEVVDSERHGLLGASASAPRRLLVRVWYPTKPDAAATPAPYFTAHEAKTTARGLGHLANFPPLLTYLKHVRTNSIRDAPLHHGRSKLPVVIYNHGYQSFAGQNNALMEELASNGYLVWSIQHSGDASDTVMPNGDVVPLDPELLKPNEGAERGDPMRAILIGRTLDEQFAGHLALRRDLVSSEARIATRSVPAWKRDIAVVIDRLAAGRVSDAIARIAGAGDFTRIGVAGMSFGGSTAGSFCQTDRRCVAGVNMDGLNFDPAAFGTAMPVPFLMLHSDIAAFQRMATGTTVNDGRSFNRFSYENFDTAGASPNVHRLEVTGAAHMGFSDFPWFMRRPVRDAILGTTPDTVLLGVQNDLVRGFFDHYLKGQRNGFPARQIELHREWLTSLDNHAVSQWWQAKSHAQRARLARQSHIGD